MAAHFPQSERSKDVNLRTVPLSLPQYEILSFANVLKSGKTFGPALAEGSVQLW